MKKHVIASLGMVTGLLCTSQNVHAQSCGTTLNCGGNSQGIDCSNITQCFIAQNTSTGYGIYASGSNTGIYGTGATTAVVGNAGHSGTGVLGETADGSGIGVKGGVNGGGIGVEGVSNSGNGVAGSTSSTSNAAISAGTPSASGLAYWGTGGMNLTGSLQIGSQNDANALTGNGSAYKPGGGSWSGTSDVRTKKDIKDFRQGLGEVLQVHPVTYRYNGLGGTTDNGVEYVGVVAQELEKIAPAMVLTRKAKLREGDAKDMDLKAVDPSAFTYMLINAVQEQQKVIERQGARIAVLERNRSPLISSVAGGLGFGGVALGLVPLGIVAARRRRG